MKSFLYWLYITVGVIGFMGFVLTIEALNWILFVCLIMGILGSATAIYINPEYVHKILTEEEDDNEYAIKY